MTTSVCATPVRLAAALILVRTEASAPAFLMGRRSGAAVFMPSKLVFPGGRLEEADLAAATAAPSPHTPCLDAARRAERPVTPQTFAGLRQAALRELEEETGVRPPDPLERPPRLVCRAVTPPGNTRRYDTWFFLQTTPLTRGYAPTGTPDGELEDIGWRTAAEARSENLHPITGFVLEQALMRLDPHDAPAPVFVRIEGGAARVRPL